MFNTVEKSQPTSLLGILEKYHERVWTTSPWCVSKSMISTQDSTEADPGYIFRANHTLCPKAKGKTVVYEADETARSLCVQKRTISAQD